MGDDERDRRRRPGRAVSEPGRLRAPTPEERAAAWAVVRDRLEPTPMVPVELRTLYGTQGGWLKLETAQPTGSFKVRGALCALATVPPGRRAVSASAGNHALGMAWAATRLGVPVTVVTAENASSAKVAALEDYARLPASPVTLVQHGLSYDEAESYARGLVATDADAVYVSAYSDYAVMAGAATIGEEIGADTLPEEPLTVVVSLGGGGLTSGILLWAASRGDVHVIGAETAASRAVSGAIGAGRRVPVPVGPTVADGLAGNLEDGAPTPGVVATGIATGLADLAVVSEDEIRAGVRWLFATHGLVAEGAGAVAAAAVLAGRVPTGDRLVIVVSGRNVSAETYARMLTDAPTGS